MLAANSERPTIHHGMVLPARKYDPESPLLPCLRPHQMMKARYRTMITMSTIPIETDSIGLNDNTPLQIYLIEFPINCIRLLKDYIILKYQV
jgi:hypothetical protein